MYLPLQQFTLQYFIPGQMDYRLYSMLPIHVSPLQCRFSEPEYGLSALPAGPGLSQQPPAGSGGGGEPEWIWCLSRCSKGHQCHQHPTHKQGRDTVAIAGVTVSESGFPVLIIFEFVCSCSSMCLVLLALTFLKSDLAPELSSSPFSPLFPLISLLAPSLSSPPPPSTPSLHSSPSSLTLFPRTPSWPTLPMMPTKCLWSLSS